MLIHVWLHPIALKEWSRLRRLRAGMVSTPPSAAGFLSLARRDRPVLGATLNRSELGGRRQAVARSGRSQVHSFFVALLVCDLHGSSEMSLCHSGSDQALAVLVRTFPNAPVASANLATSFAAWLRLGASLTAWIPCSVQFSVKMNVGM